MGSAYNRAGDVTDFRGKDFLDVDSGYWKEIHNVSLENTDYFDNNKMPYINNLIYQDYTVNAELIPIIPLAITRYLVVAKSNNYNKSYALEVGEGQDIKKLLSFNNLKSGLCDCIMNFNLHDAGFIRFFNKGNKLRFQSIPNCDIVYDFNFAKYNIRLKRISDQLYLYEYFEELGEVTYLRVEFAASDMYTIDYEALRGLAKEQLELKGKNSIANLITPKNQEFPRDTSGLDLRSVSIMKTPTTIPLFGNSRRISSRSMFVDADLILNVLLGFGLANVPHALLMKIWIKNARKGANMDEKLGALADILDALPLTEGEDAGIIKGDSLAGFKNFFDIFEALLTHIAQLEGIPRGAMQLANPTRQSSAGKQTDNKSSNIFREFFMQKLNDFEERIFDAINLALNKDYEFKNIDKSLSLTMSSNEVLQEMILATTNGFEEFITAVSKAKGISYDEAEAMLDKALVSKEKYGSLLGGIPGMPTAGGTEQNASVIKKEGEVWKGDAENEETVK